MLRIYPSSVDRRNFLRVGALGMGGLSLPGMFAAQAQAASMIRDKAVILLFMHGGPSQTETFDPKMSAPAGVRSVTGEVATSIPGVTFGGTFEKLAPLADRFTVVRSFKSGDGNHDIKPVVMKETAGANLGSLMTRVLGTNDPRTGMPTNAALYPRAVDESAGAAITQFGKFEATGGLGSAYAPFVPGSGGGVAADMELRLERGRLDDRRSLLAQLDRLRRGIDSGGAIEGFDRFQEQAFSTLVGGVAEAFDLSREDPRTVARYDTAGLVDPASISKRWNNHLKYRDHAQSLGKLLLLARRLCESGCRFVTVTTSFVWDMHADSNNATMEEGMQYVGRPFDHAVSAFIEDLYARGLQEKILLVATGEMGRTPKVNAKGGRDHWGGLTPLMFCGGGLNMGQVIGQSTRDAGEPHTEPLTNQHLVSTLAHTLFDLGQLRLDSSIPSDVSRILMSGRPIPGLL